MEDFLFRDFLILNRLRKVEKLTSIAADLVVLGVIGILSRPVCHDWQYNLRYFLFLRQPVRESLPRESQHSFTMLKKNKRSKDKKLTNKRLHVAFQQREMTLCVLCATDPAKSDD